MNAMNERRADRAARAVAEYARAVHVDLSRSLLKPADMVRDLLIDLFHYGDLIGDNVEESIVSARGHYENER